MQSKIYTSALIAVFAVSVFFSSCKKDLTVSFDKSFPGLNLVLDTTSHTGTFTISQANINTGISAFASSNGFSVNNIKSVVIKSCTIGIADTTNPIASRITFDALDSIKATLSSTGLTDMKIGTVNPMPHTGLTSITLNLNNADVTSFIKASQFSYVVTGANNAPITHKLPMTASVTFTISASITK